jgi:hypothetical protein
MTGMKAEENIQEKIIGKGRSGQVYRESDEHGNDLAIKVFSGTDSLTDFVNYTLLGAPNPYAWNEDAVDAAHYRREILTLLISYWFDSGVRIAKSYGTDWHSGEKAYQITTQFITGRPVALKHPFSKNTDNELRVLVKDVMQPLEKHLIESGFYGLVWQAGKGNPIALNNFLRDEQGNWVWIDAESGVPALFPLNPLSLLRFYIPKSFKFKHPMFDDVDTQKLKTYIQDKQQQLGDKLGDDKLTWLNEYVRRLDIYQKRWKSIKRVQRSIQYQYKKELITKAQADWYSKRPIIWTLKELSKLLKKAFLKLFFKLPRKILVTLISIKYWSVLKNSLRFLFSGKYRKSKVESLINSRLDDWQDRGQLDKNNAAFLRSQAMTESTSPYLADFIILLGLKPLTNVIELVVLPALYAAGFIGEAALAIGVAFGGIIYRTLYTIGKILYETFTLRKEQRNPRWIALIIGLIPTFGNLAYPTLMVYSAGSKSRELAEFLMYDIAARIGGKIPIWGGKDTRTEHFFNRLPDVILPKKKT